MCAAYPTIRSRPTQKPAFSTFLSTFPTPVTGNSVTNFMCLGACAEPLRALTRLISSSAFGRAPSRATTTAVTASPHLSSGTPTTATIATSACCDSTSSTSRGKILKPAGHDHVLLAIEDDHVAALVVGRDVAGMQPAVLQGFRRLFGPLPVFRHHMRRADANLAGLTGLDLMVLVVENFHLAGCDREATGQEQFRGLRIMIRLAQHRDWIALGLAVKLREPRADPLDAFDQPARRHRGRAVKQQLERGEIGPVERRMVQQHVDCYADNDRKRKSEKDQVFHPAPLGILNDLVRSNHRSPGHHVEGGSFADIFVVRSATRWLRLYGYLHFWACCWPQAR